MSNVTPCAFLSIFLVRIPKKEICSIFGNRDDIGHKHKRGFMDYQSIKITTKSKSISIHHGFRLYKKSAAYLGCTFFTFKQIKCRQMGRVYGKTFTQQKLYAWKSSDKI
ncbi:MAG: hypothetical protein C6W58_09055 [Bacillaceae bacterium]|nr:MAG: hypothetical protein C6W58_09055 [Bacillaceae bacterium]